MALHPTQQVSTIQFHLINTTILFLAREGLRRACLRIDAGAPGATRRVLRLAALAVPAGALLASGVTAALLHSVGPDGDKAYRRALVMQGASGPGPAHLVPGGAGLLAPPQRPTHSYPSTRPSNRPGRLCGAAG